MNLSSLKNFGEILRMNFNEIRVKLMKLQNKISGLLITYKRKYSRISILFIVPLYIIHFSPLFVFTVVYKKINEYI